MQVLQASEKLTSKLVGFYIPLLLCLNPNSPSDISIIRLGSLAAVPALNSTSPGHHDLDLGKQP